MTAGGFDAPAERLVPMHAQVVPDDDLPRLQRRHQDLAHEQGEDRPIGGPGHGHRRGDSGVAHGGQQVTFGPWLRGTTPTTHCPRGARP